MTTFDFDRVIERRGTDSFKWGAHAGRDVIPLPVADMDFASPPAVIEALRRRVDHGVFGYARPTPETVEAVVAAIERDYAWRIDPSWIVWLPGIVAGLAVAARMTAPGDPVLTFTPVYPPFLDPTVTDGRALIRVPMTEDPPGRWTMDPDRLAAAAPEGAAGLLMLSHPQNPTGRAFRRDELERLAEVCLRRGWIVASDEIHCDLVLEPGVRHIPFATLSPELAARTVTFMSPSKTYNVSGLSCAYALIPDAGLRRRFLATMGETVPNVNALGLAACGAALRDGVAWRAALLDYLRGNRDRVAGAVAAMPGLRMGPVEATYLAWVDTRAAGLGDDPVAAFLEGGVLLMDGRRFDGPGFVRLNFGCPRATLDEALRRMAATVSRRR